MRVVPILAILVVITGAGCKKDGDAPSSKETPKYLPTGFENLRIGMSEGDLKKLYPNATKKPAPPSALPADKAQYDPAASAESYYVLELPGDKRFKDARFAFLNNRLHFASLNVITSKCTSAFLEGMAAEMTKKTGVEFLTDDYGGGITQAMKRFTTDKLRIEVAVGKAGSECWYGLMYSNWLDWKSKENVGL